MDTPQSGILAVKTWTIAQVLIMENLEVFEWTSCVFICKYIVLFSVWIVHTDLFGKEGHDSEDDKCHKDTVRPELQFVPIHSPEEKKTFKLILNFIKPLLPDLTHTGTDAEIKSILQHSNFKMPSILLLQN